MNREIYEAIEKSSEAVEKAEMFDRELAALYKRISETHELPSVFLEFCQKSMERNAAVSQIADFVLFVMLNITENQLKEIQRLYGKGGTYAKQIN